MSYPQAIASTALLAGHDFFRLNTLLVSPGDIYESDQGSHALALGPDSDIANVDVFYLDPNNPGSMNSFRVSPDRSMVGMIKASVVDNYAPLAIPGQVLIAPADLYNPTWRPVDFDAADDVISYVQPVMDVIQYFTPQPGLIPQRNDKTYEFEKVGSRGVGTPTGEGWVVLPAWGRKSASFMFKNGFAVALEVTLYGVKLGISQSGIGVTSAVQRELMAKVTLTNISTPTTNEAAYVYKFSASGGFDYFAIKYHALGATGPDFGATTHIIVSDDAL